MIDLDLVAQDVVTYIYNTFRERGGRYLISRHRLEQLIRLAGFGYVIKDGDEETFNQLSDRINEKWRLIIKYLNQNY